MSYAMVTIYGMNEVIGNISFNDQSQDYRFAKPYSEQTATVIDNEVRKLIGAAYVRTKELLSSKKAELEIIAKELLDKEIIFKADMDRLIGQRPFDEKHHEAIEIKEAINEVIPEGGGDTNIPPIDILNPNKDEVKH